MHRNRIYYTRKTSKQKSPEKDAEKAKVCKLLDNFKVSAQQSWQGKKLSTNNLAEC